MREVPSNQCQGWHWVPCAGEDGDGCCARDCEAWACGGCEERELLLLPVPDSCYRACPELLWEVVLRGTVSKYNISLGCPQAKAGEPKRISPVVYEWHSQGWVCAGSLCDSGPVPPVI